MRKILLLLAFAAGAAAVGTAQAQIKCWNENGKRVCGDAPPPGAKVTTLNNPSGPSTPSPAAQDGAKKGPLSPAEREQDYRKRQAESQKAAEKAATQEKEEQAKRENCARARESLRALDSGQRISRTDAKGDRYILDEAQAAQEAARTREIAQQYCN